MSTVPNKVIYSMIGVSKYYDKKAVLKDIYLSYFYSAKIGVLGLNGSVKSSLLRILSGGEKRRVAFCRLLLQKPDIQLLDEPTNHLDAESVAWLEHHIQQYEGTVIAVTHDRYFLDNVAGWILELDRGHGIPWEGNYSSWLEQKRVRLQQEEKTQTERQKTLQLGL